MNYVVGVDLGTSAVKVLLVNREGNVVKEASREYPVINTQSGYIEQHPEDWVSGTFQALREITSSLESGEQIDGISFAGQMHGLVMVDAQGEVIRPAILWNDTRTTLECQEIVSTLGEQRLFELTKNPALEGFTLPKMIWVKKHEPDNWQRLHQFMLPKDYVRYRMTGEIAMDLSDAAGTLLLNVEKGEWSSDVLEAFHIEESRCPKLMFSTDQAGGLLPDVISETGLDASVKVFAGGADNACGAIGAGVLKEGLSMCSIGTSGVVLSYEKRGDLDFDGKVHYFNHGVPGAYYTMGVTLAAGDSLSWYRKNFAQELSFDELVREASLTPAGAEGLVFTPYISGERTPLADAIIRGSFIGMDKRHTRGHFTRAVLEGITFSLNESLNIFRDGGKVIDQIVSIGGGAKSDFWLQLQADIFDAEVVKLNSEQGPGMGAAMIAAVGSDWFNDFTECAERFLAVGTVVKPNMENKEFYKSLFSIYKQVYNQTKELSRMLNDCKERVVK
ncbi:D-xylulose kinase [Jeotgalibacillus malaysiensis]|uniref:Xylulose kinase n=1 Tax=Jeotgalibacillus malaysiensis TaxID=1508404 RepID=A0A0B5ATS2_9BACL|nr:xylulokinase [Jeotgalibacillus malaysiensis]AJD92117.1 D-xylulose kinase [Jeotgalibacillus malaysiensis]